jgi:hypothetical protein
MTAEETFGELLYKKFQEYGLYYMINGFTVDTGETLNTAKEIAKEISIELLAENEKLKEENAELLKALNIIKHEAESRTIGVCTLIKRIANNAISKHENKSCDKSCSPSDWRNGGKCDLNGCYFE